MKSGTRDILAKGFDEKAMTITARYEDGVFKPLENVTINEGTIVEVHVPSYADRLKDKSRSEDFAFYGMWKDRTDIRDSVKYINDLRRDIEAERPVVACLT
jgi:predicted DNA-binding antitoxin AbrB/MazE fold protein